MAQMFGVGKRSSTLLEAAKGIGKSILRELFVQPGIEEAPLSLAKERQLKLKEWLKPRTDVEERAAKVPRAISEISQEIGTGILKGITGRHIEPEPTKFETEAGERTDLTLPQCSKVWTQQKKGGENRMTNKIQVMVNEYNLPLYDFIEMFPDTNIVWLDNSKFYDSGIYYLKTIKLGQLLFPGGRGLQFQEKER